MCFSSDFDDLFQLGMSGTLKMYPFVLHSVAMSVFASFLGPFGGFFASGFKRAFKIKVGPFYFVHYYMLMLLKDNVCSGILV